MKVLLQDGNAQVRNGHFQACSRARSMNHAHALHVLPCMLETYDPFSAALSGVLL